MTEPYLGQISLFGFNFAPRGWAQCNGQLLPIQQNAALNSLLSTFYGGNGTTTFALPNLQSRTPIGTGQGSGLTNRTIGQTGGEESHTLSQTEMPSHAHGLQATTAAAATGTLPATTGIFATPAKVPVYRSGGSASIPLNDPSLVSAGGGQAHSNIQPYLTVNFCIALIGIFPTS